MTNRVVVDTNDVSVEVAAQEVTFVDVVSVGPQGIQGPIGSSGADSTVPGPPGPIGPPGADSTVPGPPGPTGATGATGAASTVPGPTGPPGAASTVPGPQGPIGLTGATGPQGIPGASGGTVGPAGGSPFTAVASLANLPAASSNVGKGYYVTDTMTCYVSDGTVWRLLYGDTLNRDITTLLDPGWRIGTTVGYLRLRRIGNMCYTAGRLQRVTVGTPYGGAAVFVTPTGFVPNPGYVALGSAMLGSKSIGAVSNTFGSTRIDVNFYNVAGSYGLDEYAMFYASWWTDQAWPTTLPGV